MCEEIYPGTCILLPKPGHETRHLWVVLTDPDEDLNVVIVNLTSLREYSDTTVVLQQGEHRFIRHPTVVNYLDARLASANALQEITSKPGYDFDDDLEPLILERIQIGLIHSPNTSNEIREYCQLKF